jgi:hypothetical protein
LPGFFLDTRLTQFYTEAMKNTPRRIKPKDPVTPPSPPHIPIPISFGVSQPLPGATLDIQSLIRDLLEGRLRPSVLRKL